MVVSRRQIYICDRHDAKGEEVIIERDGVYGIDGEWYRAGLCPICDGDILAAFREFILEHGIKLTPEEVAEFAQATGKRPPPHNVGPVETHDAQCLWCPYVRTLSGLQYHVRSEHKFKGFKEAYGNTCPLCGEQQKSVLGQHAHAAHGTRHVAELFIVAQKAGDPHGVVAARLKAA